MAKNIVDIFNSDFKSDTIDTKINLHESFQGVFVTSLVHAQLINFLKDTNTTSSSIMRKLMRILLPEVNWSEFSLKKIQTQYPKEFGAAKCNFNLIISIKLI